MNLYKIIEDFEAKHTCQLADRHAQNITLLCDQMDNDMHREGFYYRDLVEVARVLDLVFKNLCDNKVISSSQIG